MSWKEFSLFLVMLLIFNTGCSQIEQGKLNTTEQNITSNTANNFPEVTNPLALESKSYILSAGISEDYFNNHFELIEVFDSGSPINGQSVTWRYYINEYNITLYDQPTYNTYENGTHYRSFWNLGNNNLYGAYDIIDTISRQNAEDIMYDCIGEFEQAELRYDGHFYGSWQRGVSHPSLYLTATSTNKEPWGCGGYNVQIGKIDLETGECKISIGGAVGNC